MQIAAIGLAREACQHRQPLGEAAERPPPAQITAGIDDDAAQSRRKFGLAPEIRDLFEKQAAHVLRDVVCVRSRAHDLPCQAVDPVIMSSQQRFERVAIAVPGGGDKVCIGTGLNVAHSSARRAMSIAIGAGRLHG